METNEAIRAKNVTLMESIFFPIKVKFHSIMKLGLANFIEQERGGGSGEFLENGQPQLIPMQYQGCSLHWGGSRVSNLPTLLSDLSHHTP